jgi:hypothetical protein
MLLRWARQTNRLEDRRVRGGVWDLLQEQELVQGYQQHSQQNTKYQSTAGHSGLRRRRRRRLVVVAVEGGKTREAEGTAVGGASSKQGGVGSRTEESGSGREIRERVNDS